MPNGEPAITATGPGARIGRPRNCVRANPKRHIRSYPPDHILRHADEDLPQTVGVVRSGLARLVRFNRDGRRQILNLILPGEVLGDDAQRRAGYTVDAATPVEIAYYDRAWFRERLSRDSRFRQMLYHQETLSLERLRWLALAIGAMGPDERISAFIASAPSFMPYEPLPDGTGILKQLITRRDLADLLSTSVETICRTLKALEKDGLIVMHGSRQLRIIDRGGLSDNCVSKCFDWRAPPIVRSAFFAANDSGQ